MGQPVSLAITKPCTELWEDMHPTSAGRHCASCQKVVQDFTQFSDAELVAWFSKRSESVCGRLRDDQLTVRLYSNQPVVVKGFGSWLRWAVALALGWQTAKAQDGPPKQDLTPPTLPMYAAPTVKKAAAPVRTSDLGYTLYSVSGKVFDANNLPLPGINIVLKGTNRGTATDAAGSFNLTIFKGDEGKPVELGFSQIGFTYQEVAITTENRSALAVQMKEDNSVMGEVVVIPSSTRISPARKVQTSIKRLFIRN